MFKRRKVMNNMNYPQNNNNKEFLERYAVNLNQRSGRAGELEDQGNLFTGHGRPRGRCKVSGRV